MEPGEGSRPRVLPFTSRAAQRLSQKLLLLPPAAQVNLEFMLDAGLAGTDEQRNQLLKLMASDPDAAVAYARTILK